MNITFEGRAVSVFNLLSIQRSESNQTDLHTKIKEFILKTEAYGYTGILLPELNSYILNPWFFADMLVNISQKLIPFIAINPLYTHPFYTAKHVANISSFFNRPIYLNYITGVGLFDAKNLGDAQTHDSKYDRLVEYLQVVNGLINAPNGYSFQGNFYNINNLALPQHVSEANKPSYCIAGGSEAALNAIQKTSAARLTMAMNLEDLKKLNATKQYRLNFHFGIMARETDEESNQALTAFCPENKKESDLLHFVTKKSEIVWKKELLKKAKEQSATGVYNLQPFANRCADVPYLVGSYKNIAKLIFEYLQNGLDLLIVEVPITGQDEFKHIQQVFEALKELTHQHSLVK